jgi:hypothetical protein
LEDGNISKKRKKYECDDNLILNWKKLLLLVF